MKAISVVVEGDGDQGAMPVVIRTHLQRNGIYDIAVKKPINAKGRTKLLRSGELERFARLASLQTNAAAVLVTCDADDDAVCNLGPQVTARCMAAVPHMPIRACLAVREFENWLLASAETLAPTATPPLGDYEAIAAVHQVAAWRAPRKYVKPIHQPAFAAGMDLDLVASRCPSFARLLRCIDELIAEIA
ncbi:MAG: DUF4276 family protein [Actinomycetota bacterium]|nr:DUF4276 family protein [Actinomycetota bacterium]